jgi:hypothetical protein
MTTISDFQKCKLLPNGVSTKYEKPSIQTFFHFTTGVIDTGGELSGEYRDTAPLIIKKRRLTL